MEVKILKNTVAKLKRIDSTLLAKDEKINLVEGYTLPCKSIKEGGEQHWLIEFEKGNNKWFVYKPHVKAIFDYIITYEHFKACLPHASNADIDLFFEPLNNAFREFEINTLARLAAFIAQVAHESGSLRYKEEIASGVAYEGRRDLGNIYPGDGRRYKGRGVFQLTGRHNYGWASKLLGIDLINNPLEAANPITSSRIAGLYWKDRDLNKYADWNSTEGFKIITRRINGGLNGWRDRLNHWTVTKKALFIPKK
ncbi:MAG: glycoside hydrolase family 19 protein [Xenococcus sp. (in: cyanobacteria)]